MWGLKMTGAQKPHHIAEQQVPKLRASMKTVQERKSGLLQFCSCLFHLDANSAFSSNCFFAFVLLTMTMTGETRSVLELY